MTEEGTYTLDTVINGVSKIAANSFKLQAKNEVNDETFNYGAYYKGPNGNITKSGAEEALSNHLLLRS